ncbi:MAG TPA: hypothetical protein VMU80_12740 [Bryobacteraceae bacterium]|nr:hypothetical protein [Bryobacteraceae bacterium]
MVRRLLVMAVLIASATVCGGNHYLADALARLTVSMTAYAASRIHDPSPRPPSPSS